MVSSSNETNNNNTNPETCFSPVQCSTLKTKPKKRKKKKEVSKRRKAHVYYVTRSPPDAHPQSILYLRACQVRVHVGDSGLCCSVCVTSLECWLTPLCVDCTRAVWASTCYSRQGLSPFLTGRTVCSPNILRTVRRTIIRSLIELLLRRTWFGHFDELCILLNWLIMRCKLRPELAAEAQ